MPGDPWAIAARPFLWPGEDLAHPLGSDLLGRDILRGIVHGARVSLLIGLSATAAALGIGITVGACAGYFRGWIDDALMRMTELFQTIPNFLLAVVLVALFRASIVDHRACDQRGQLARHRAAGARAIPVAARARVRAVLRRRRHG